MQIEERVVSNVTILDLKGKITLGGGDEILKDKVNSLVNQGYKKILLNFADVPYVDSAGLGEIVRTYTTVSRQGGSMKLLNLTKRITDLLSITKLLTTAAAIHYLGPDFKFHTTFWRRGPVERGNLVGSLLVVGGGDPNISGRFYGDDINAVFDRWAEGLRQAGVTRVTGDLVLNATYFDSLGAPHLVELTFVLETKGGVDAVTGSVGNTFRFFGEAQDSKFLSLGTLLGSDRVVGTGTVTFSTCGTASYDTKIAVYEQAGCDNLDARIEACVDDTSGCGTTTTVAITATAGEPYMIRLGGYSSGQGSGTLLITAPTCGPVCGNGVIEAGEECDGAAPPNQVCNAQCKLEFTALVINEIYYDAPGNDAGSFIELAGPPNASLDGYRLKFVNGAGGVEYTAALKLDGRTIGASGYFLVAQDITVAVPAGTTSMISGKANLQNGPDSVQLVQGSTVVDAIAYGNFGTTNVPAGEGQPAGDPGGTVQSLARLPNGADTGNNAADLGVAAPTPGAAN